MDGELTSRDMASRYTGRLQEGKALCKASDEAASGRADLEYSVGVSAEQQLWATELLRTATDV